MAVTSALTAVGEAPLQVTHSQEVQHLVLPCIYNTLHYIAYILEILLTVLFRLYLFVFFHLLQQPLCNRRLPILTCTVTE
jgi:hypothetical protein